MDKKSSAVTEAEEIITVTDEEPIANLIAIDVGWENEPMLTLPQWVDVVAGMHQWVAERQAEIAHIEAVIVPMMEGKTIDTKFSIAAPQWRSQTNHEAAAREANVPTNTIERASTTKTTVAWAKVTKGIDPNILAAHTESKLTGYKFSVKEEK